MAQTHFYAIEDDLLPVLETVEKKGPLKYTLAGRFLAPDLKCFHRGCDIPNLGRATNASAVGSERYLVSDPNLRILVDAVNESDGLRSFHVNQLMNNDTVTFNPAGQWTEDIILYGRVATAYNDGVSKQLLTWFRSAIRKHFTSVRGVAYVGPKALEALKNGKRLTLAAQTPRDFDLTL